MLSSSLWVGKKWNKPFVTTLLVGYSFLFLPLPLEPKITSISAISRSCSSGTGTGKARFKSLARGDFVGSNQLRGFCYSLSPRGDLLDGDEPPLHWRPRVLVAVQGEGGHQLLPLLGRRAVVLRALGVGPAAHLERVAHPDVQVLYHETTKRSALFSKTSAYYDAPFVA